jgi:hypothetical protein
MCGRTPAVYNWNAEAARAIPTMRLFLHAFPTSGEAATIGRDWRSLRTTVLEGADLRAILLAGFLSAAATFGITGSAFADASVAGNWKADLGGNVVINMNVTPDGGWSSQTLQKNKVVRQMKGTYTQTPATEGKGTLVFTPTQATVKSGSVKPETDQYEVTDSGQRLKLTSSGDTMDFVKQ